MLSLDRGAWCFSKGDVVEDEGKRAMSWSYHETAENPLSAFCVFVRHCFSLVGLIFLVHVALVPVSKRGRYHAQYVTIVGCVCFWFGFRGPSKNGIPPPPHSHASPVRV